MQQALTSMSGATVLSQVSHWMRAGVGRNAALASSGGEGRVVRGASPTPVRVSVARVSMATASRALHRERASHPLRKTLPGQVLTWSFLLSLLEASQYL